MEKQIFVSQLSFNFNLRFPKQDKPTLIYLVAGFKGKKHKISLGCKVLPSQWDKRRQRAYVSAYLSELDNRNNAIVNNIISHTKIRISNFIYYLSENPNCFDNFKDELNMALNDKGKTYKKEDVILYLRKQVDASNTKKQSTKTAYLYQLDTFKEFWKKTKKEKMCWSDINIKLINEYEEYLFNTKNKSGEYIDDATVGEKVAKIITILKEYHIDKTTNSEKFDLYKSRITTYEKPRLLYNSEDNTFALYDEEIGILKNLELTGIEEYVRDLFIFQIWTGQRISDIKKICNSPEVIDMKRKLISVVQEKESSKVIIPIFPVAEDILNKYNWRLKNIREYEYNKVLKNIAIKAKLNRTHIVTRQHKRKITTSSIHIYEDIASHAARRTFITMMLEEGLLSTQTLMQITGHKTEKSFMRYAHLNREKIALDALEKINKTAIGQKENSNKNISKKVIDKELYDDAIITNYKLAKENKETKKRLKTAKEINDIETQHSEYNDRLHKDMINVLETGADYSTYKDQKERDIEINELADEADWNDIDKGIEP